MNIKLIKTIEAENKRTDRYEIDDLYIVDATYYNASSSMHQYKEILGTTSSQKSIIKTHS